MTEMMSTLVSCNVKNFRKLTDMGANVFSESPGGSNFLQMSVGFSCDVITQDLIDAGLEYIINENINQMYGHYRLIENALSPKFPSSKSSALKTLKSINQ